MRATPSDIRVTDAPGAAMFKTIVFSAFGAGLVVCVVASAVQYLTTGPLILHAERYEAAGGAAHHQAYAATVEKGPGVIGDEGAQPWAPADRFERIAFSALANLLVGTAVSLILLALMTLRGARIDASQGFLWGGAGFVAASLLPALGLPPELPGTPAPELADRQLWWMATGVASAAGIALIVFGRHWVAKAVGLAILVLPHAVGAPIPPSHEVAYPGALAGEFVVASLVVSAVLWTLAGLSAGWLHQRLTRLA